MKKIKALILTSDSLRHKYFSDVMSNFFDIKGVIVESKKNYYIEAKKESIKVQEHFNQITEYENKYFEGVCFPENCKVVYLNEADINSYKLTHWSKNQEIEVILLFGTTILTDCWLESFKDRIVNLHLGLSPYYRGSATLFWPIHNNEICCVGSTIHIATKRVDAGNIIARIKPELNIYDNYYDINLKTIKQSIDAMPFYVHDYLSGKVSPVAQDLSSGVLYKKSDFTKNSLIKALSVVGDGLTEEQIVEIKESKLCNY